MGSIFYMIRAAYDKLCRPAGRHTINYAALRGGIRQIMPPWQHNSRALGFLRKVSKPKGFLFASPECLCKAHRISALPCNNVNMPPLPSGTGKYAAHGPHYASHGPHYLPTGHIMLPSGCIMLPSGLRPSGSIMQPSGSIMFP